MQAQPRVLQLISTMIVNTAADRLRITEQQVTETLGEKRISKLRQELKSLRRQYR